MKTLLKLNTSLFSADGESSRIADRFATAWTAGQHGARVIERDLATDPVPHLTADAFRAFGTPAEARNATQQAAVAYSDALIDELVRADVIALALPMYNFGIPSTLKAWFDQVARAGVTFKYTDKGAVGLVTGKKAYVFATRGGRYAGTPADHQSAYVRTFLSFIGIDDVEFVYAEGLALGAEPKATALAEAARSVDRLVVPQRVAA